MCRTARATVSVSLVLFAVLLATAGTCVAADGPVVIGPVGYHPGESFLATMPNGAVDFFFSQNTGSGWEIARKETTNNGYSWTDPISICSLDPADFPGGTMPPAQTLPLVTNDGRLQLFWLVWRNSNLDIWQGHSNQGLTNWSTPTRLLAGYCGAMFGRSQFTGGPHEGRIVLPYAYVQPGVPVGPPTGPSIVTSRVSDDDGDSWSAPTAALTTPCTPNYNGSSYGASEPNTIELADNRLWMVIRTQTGRLYESFSTDGQDWSEAAPTQFYSSDSPASPQRLPDGRIVLFWNNCENTSRINGLGVYTTRDVLHAAISSDEGQTWSGYREVYLDPDRNQTPTSGDQGAAYAMPAATADGKILLATGQSADRRQFVLIDPDWLEETDAFDDFSQGLDRWSVFKPYGLPSGWFRPRVQGSQLEDHPTIAGEKVLHVRRPDDKPGDEAIWSTPSGRHGEVEMSVMLEPGHDDLIIALADRYIQPSDDQGALQEIFRLPIYADGRLPGGGATMNAGQWYTLGLDWNLDEDYCRILLDGQQVGLLSHYNFVPDSPGISYLRFRSMAAGVDTAGMLINWVQVDVAPEPSTLILSGIAALGLLAYGRRNRRRRSE